MISLDGLRVVFMGTPEFAVPSLQSLIDSKSKLLAVVTQPDRPKGRGRRVVISPVKELAVREGLTVLQPLKVRDEDFIRRLEKLSPDVIVVVAFGQILPEAILDIPPMGCINVHASLLPKYRGAAPINRAVADGEKITGITTMFMDKGLDTGDMLLKKEVDILPADDAQTLYRTLSIEGGRLLLETLEGLKGNTIKPEKQDDSLSTYAPILKKEDGLIDWTRSAVDIVNMVRGFLPWPVAHTTLKGKNLKIYEAEALSGKGTPGAVINTENNCIDIASGEGVVRITDMQLEGKKRMKTSDFLRGCSLDAGEIFGS